MGNINSDYVSTSAMAHGDTLGTVLARMQNEGIRKIEIGIGPRPEKGILDTISRYSEGTNSVTAHANCPLGADGELLNQERDFTKILLSCDRAGIDRYTVHAPRKRDFPTFDEFLKWAALKWGAAGERVTTFGVETMYPAREPFWLDSYDEVARFLEWTDILEWPHPLVADVAHLQIGVEQGTWTEDQVELVLRSEQVLEFHYSDNDGINDKHQRYVEGSNPRIDRWLSLCNKTSMDFVDEGRRRVKT